jgi:peptidoglycan/xylan/chitin deacetylase (PgdA/CDA1 family)
MKKLTIFLLLLNFTVQAQQKINWPNHKKAVIVLTYDDAISSQLEIAIPQLDSVGFKGTFFLIGNNLNSQNIPAWRAASVKGHELANHTLYHPCLSTAFKMDPADYSESYNFFTILREIGLMNSLLNAIDGKTSHTLAYPCTETSVGGKSYVDTLQKSGLIKYARIGGGDNAVITDFKNLNPLLVPAWGLPGNNTGDELIAFVKKVQQSGGMGVFMFHGVGGNYITTPAASHRALIAYLKLHQDEIWVATFQEAMDYASKAGK